MYDTVSVLMDWFVLIFLVVEWSVKLSVGEAVVLNYLYKFL